MRDPDGNNVEAVCHVARRTFVGFGGKPAWRSCAGPASSAPPYRRPTAPNRDEDRRLVGLWAADCAERVLPLFEAKAPADTRPREAIEGPGHRARGQADRTAALCRLGGSRSPREVGDPVATAAARAASYAAATPYTHALATPHRVRHVLGPALYQAQARELAAGDDPSVGDEEIRWAIEHASPAVRGVVRRMPVCSSGRNRLGALLRQLDAGRRH